MSGCRPHFDDISCRHEDILKTMDERNIDDEAELREFARKSLKKKSDAWQFLFVTLLLTGALTVVWWMSSPTAYYWPGWVLFGMGIGVVASFMDAYLTPFRGHVSSSDIDAEVERLKARSRNRPQK